MLITILVMSTAAAILTLALRVMRPLLTRKISASAIRPDLSGEDLRAILFRSGWIDDKGLHFVDPPAFIKAALERRMQ